MTSSTELRLVLTELTERFVEEVLAAIERAPLAELADTLPRSAGRGPSRVAVEPPAASRTARAVPRAGVPGRAPAARSTVPAPTKLRAAVADEDDSARHFVRRSADEIQRLREVILQTLRAAKGPIPASDIAQDVGVRTADLAFPMAQLRDQGVVAKDGQRTKAVYWLVESQADRGKKKKKRKDR